MEIAVFWQQVSEEIAKYDLLQHPFYQAWTAGELTKEDLKFYGEQYYHHVSQFPAYLTSLHSRLSEGAVRRDVIANAYEEECVPCSHAELWMRFVEGVGGERSGRDAVAPIQEIGDLVKMFRSLAKEAPIAAVFGAVYAYESQVPRIAAEKLNGLRKHYGVGERACAYFTLHEKADVFHANVWRRIISELVEQDERRAAEVFEGVSEAAGALWTSLDGIDRHRQNRNGKGCPAGSVN